MSNTTQSVSPETFGTKVLQSSLPVLVDYWASWCMPCKVLAPQLERIAKEYAGQLEVFSVNADDHLSFVQDQDVSGLPTLVVYVDGKEVDRKVGAAGGYNMLKELVKPWLP